MRSLCLGVFFGPEFSLGEEKMIPLSEIWPFLPGWRGEKALQAELGPGHVSGCRSFFGLDIRIQ